MTKRLQFNKLKNDRIPKVSVLMPAYNCESYISDAIESILNQTFSDFEFIIIDDGSSDKTWDIIQEYAKKDERIIIFNNTNNIGVSKTRNLLIKNVKAKYILWQDADDMSVITRIEQQYKFMESQKEVGICGGYLQFIDLSNKITSIRKYACQDNELRRNIFKYSPVSQGASIVRTEMLKKSGIYDKNLRQAEDLDMTFRIGKYSQFSNIQNVVLYYRWNSCSITAHRLRENIVSTLIVRWRAFRQYGYKISTIDTMIFILTWVVLLLPTKLTYKIFNHLRNEI